MKVKEIMTANVRTCRPESNLAAAAGTMWDADCGALPVVDEQGRLAGIITDRDIAIALGTRNRVASEIAVSEVMSKNVFVCASEDNLDTALKTIAEKRVRRLPVLDGGTTLTGILTLNDIAVRAGESPEAAIKYADAGRALRAVCEHRAATVAAT